jgi:hypothetical protein
MMNTNTLARHYETLTPWERLPLMVAATARGDDIEFARLGRSASRHRLRVANYSALSERLRELATLYMLRQLNAAMFLGQALGLLGPAVVAARCLLMRQVQLWKVAQTTAYRFVVNADGWKLFCAELQVDPDDPLRDLAGYTNVRESEEIARVVACSREQALADLREAIERKEYVQGSSSAAARCDYRLETAEEVARSMRMGLDRFQELWS